ncbi:MAG: hypothetical protein WCL57_07430 [Chloroflexota bacterium]
MKTGLAATGWTATGWAATMGLAGVAVAGAATFAAGAGALVGVAVLQALNSIAAAMAAIFMWAFIFITSSF